ncbi:hypothetical protein FACS1894219_12750 [Clostridia bacterium]|nr:hypothetical protein FACS1894219_12750 [Clostridia bacterium]
MIGFTNEITVWKRGTDEDGKESFDATVYTAAVELTKSGYARSVCARIPQKDTCEIVPGDLLAVGAKSTIAGDPRRASFGSSVYTIREVAYRDAPDHLVRYVSVKGD